MESRAHNTMGLPGYQTPHALSQLRASVLCAREYLLDLLAEGLQRDTLKLCERVFRFCSEHCDGKRVEPIYGNDPFNAVPLNDARLPEKFWQTRYPQMVAKLQHVRERLRPVP